MNFGNVQNSGGAGHRLSFDIIFYNGHFYKLSDRSNRDDRYPIALQNGLEVNLSGLQETAEAYFQRHDKDEAGHRIF